MSNWRGKKLIELTIEERRQRRKDMRATQKQEKVKDKVPRPKFNEVLLSYWVNACMFIPPNGWKSSGIEHRIMSEAGLVEAKRSRDPYGIGEVWCKIADILNEEYSPEIKALYVYAKSGYRISNVKDRFKVNTAQAHQLIDVGWYVMHSAYSVMKSISYVNEGER